jgi:PAS domain S-box-containing protein
MDVSHSETLRALLRRVDEVRGLSERSETQTALEPGEPDVLLRTLGELVEELERSHRRLIESNVQLVSLREVANTVVSAEDAGEASRTVTRYLAHAFGFDDVFLLLVDRDRQTLEGSWTHRAGGRERTFGLSVPVLGDHGAVTRALWLNRTVVQHAPHRHPVVVLPDGHPLLDALEGLGPVVSVPLQRGHSIAALAEPHELCGFRCVIGDTALLAPPPGAAAGSWAIDREERQLHCLGCDLLPLLGVIGMARRTGPSPGESGDLELLESIALSVAPMIENARLTHELRRSERFREHVLDSMASALVAVNMKGEVLTYNRVAEELLGWRATDVIGCPMGDVLGADGEAAMRDTLEHGRTLRREETLLRANDGAPVPVSLTTSLLRQDRRTVFGAIGTFVDLRPFRRAEEQARRLDRLAALGRFTSSVAHEIRNPLAGIAAGVQYLTRSMPLEGPQKESLEFLTREVQRLDVILQDLFDITHPRGLRLADGAIEDTVRRALRCAEALALEHGVELVLDAMPHTPVVPHDADQLEQVFLNLVKNAIEASPRGARVRVRIGAAAALTPAASGPPSVLAMVEDEGCGIDDEHLKTVFEPFHTTKPGGTGLGLYISHDIVKRHGGGITVHSESGHGTTFTVELPLENTGGTR